MIPVLPYTAEVLDSLLARYNAAVVPLPAAAVLMAVAVLGHAVRPVRGGDRLASLFLAAAWAWVGIVFQLRYAATIDFMATLYGGFFVAQAALLLWTGVVRKQLIYRVKDHAAGRIGCGLAVLAVAGYPLLCLLTGHDWMSLPWVGAAPDPTVLLTLGLLLTAQPVPRYLLVVPLMWSLVAGMAALSLDTPERLILPAAAILAAVIAERARRTPTP